MTDNTTERWAELNVQQDGIGVSLYEESDEDNRPVVVDETWLTRVELETLRAEKREGVFVLSE